MSTPITPHFKLEEFACHCCGKLPINTTQLQKLCYGLEKLRAAFYPEGLIIVSGARCRANNNSVGGAQNSMHLLPNSCAADVSPVATYSQVRALKVFTGIGVNKSTGLVSHVDCRKGNVSAVNPVTWQYANR